MERDRQIYIKTEIIIIHETDRMSVIQHNYNSLIGEDDITLGSS